MKVQQALIPCLLFILLSCGKDSPPKIQWHTNPEQALRAAANLQRPLLVTLFAPWCPHCQQLNRTVFSDSKVVEKINREFIALVIDITKPQSKHESIKGLSAKEFPTIFILRSDGSVIAQIPYPEAKTVPLFISALDRVLGLAQK